MSHPNYTYKGRLLETLTRDELLIAAKWAYDALEEQRKWAQQEREMNALFRDARKALAR